MAEHRRIRDRSGVVLEADLSRTTLRGPEARVVRRVDRLVETHADSEAVDASLPLGGSGRVRCREEDEEVY